MGCALHELKKAARTKAATAKTKEPSAVIEGQVGDFFEALCNSLAQDEAVDPRSFEGHPLLSWVKDHLLPQVRGYFRERSSALCKACEGAQRPAAKNPIWHFPTSRFQSMTLYGVRRPTPDSPRGFAGCHTARFLAGQFTTPRRLRLATAAHFSTLGSQKVFSKELENQARRQCQQEQHRWGRVLPLFMTAYGSSHMIDIRHGDERASMGLPGTAGSRAPHCQQRPSGSTVRLLNITGNSALARRPVGLKRLFCSPNDGSTPRLLLQFCPRRGAARHCRHREPCTNAFSDSLSFLDEPGSRDSQHYDRELALEPGATPNPSWHSESGTPETTSAETNSAEIASTTSSCTAAPPPLALSKSSSTSEESEDAAAVITLGSPF